MWDRIPTPPLHNIFPVEIRPVKLENSVAPIGHYQSAVSRNWGSNFKENWRFLQSHRPVFRRPFPLEWSFYSQYLTICRSFGSQRQRRTACNHVNIHRRELCIPCGIDRIARNVASSWQSTYRKLRALFRAFDFSADTAVSGHATIWSHFCFGCCSSLQWFFILLHIFNFTVRFPSAAYTRLVCLSYLSSWFDIIVTFVLCSSLLQLDSKVYAVC